ncbi:hypothetical protein GALMADRAFT_881431 [Galerina marginata CBS 339.88]|uniref:Secreted protein n=1 Tax=Galerina marginata (strain CBS 339.88) TaxID=685588 RepID=A0A067SKZ9_GALM3|nr:hypothetical protein GALMADRAFT_881431 [Galerina marginata CBS 339.88]
MEQLWPLLKLCFGIFGASTLRGGGGGRVELIHWIIVCITNRRRISVDRLGFCNSALCHCYPPPKRNREARRTIQAMRPCEARVNAPLPILVEGGRRKHSTRSLDNCGRTITKQRWRRGIFAGYKAARCGPCCWSSPGHFLSSFLSLRLLG